MLLVGVPAAHADLVQLRHGTGARLVREAGGTELVPELRLWRVPSASLKRLRHAGLVQRAQPERIFVRTSAATEPTDPLVPTEWWRPVIGADRVDPPGPGKPVTIVDSGIDITHP